MYDCETRHFQIRIPTPGNITKVSCPLEQVWNCVWISARHLTWIAIWSCIDEILSPWPVKALTRHGIQTPVFLQFSCWLALFSFMSLYLWPGSVNPPPPSPCSPSMPELPYPATAPQKLVIHHAPQSSWIICGKSTLGKLVVEILNWLRPQKRFIW